MKNWTTPEILEMSVAMTASGDDFSKHEANGAGKGKGNNQKKGGNSNSSTPTTDPAQYIIPSTPIVDENSPS